MLDSMEIRLFDTHAHPQMHQFDADRDRVIRRALDSGVGMICVGVDLESSRQAIALAERYDGLYASVGLHPNDNLDEQYDGSAYAKLAEHPKVVAIGEIGLDFYRTAEPERRAFQKERFQLQLQLAKAVRKPVIIHCRDAHEDMRGILAAYDGPRGVIHSFTGTPGDAQAYVAADFSIGLNGILTFARNYDIAVRTIPLERIILETDSPYLAPEPHRGRRNEPFYIYEVAKKVAELKGLPLLEVQKLTTENAKSLFLKV